MVRCDSVLYASGWVLGTVVDVVGMMQTVAVPCVAVISRLDYWFYDHRQRVSSIDTKTAGVSWRDGQSGGAGIFMVKKNDAILCRASFYLRVLNYEAELYLDQIVNEILIVGSSNTMLHVIRRRNYIYFEKTIFVVIKNDENSCCLMI